MHYTGYCSPEHTLYTSLGEPKGYWGNLAIKELIERQINGDPELVYEGVNKKVPWLSWGPYFWADGSNPRNTDGLTWFCEEYRDDDTGGGFHLEDAGKAKEAEMIKAFFETDRVASYWYLDAEKWNGCEDSVAKVSDYNVSNESGFSVYPNPTHTTITFELPLNATGILQYEIVNLAGQITSKGSINADLIWEETKDVSNLAEGIYVLRLNTEHQQWTNKFMVQH
jgi:hypothetical protein